MKEKLKLDLFDAEAASSAASPMPEVGVQTETAPNAENKKDVAETKNAEFEKLIKGEYKEQFENRIHDNLKRRFKENSKIKESAEKANEIINLLKEKYGILSDDTSLIADAIKKDDGFIKREAEKKGMDLDVLKRMRQLEFENESIKKQILKDKENKKMDETISDWMRDAEKIMGEHPEFNLEEEAANPEFTKLLKAGVGLERAYYAMHHNEIIKKMVEKAAEDAQIKTTESIRARSIRPPENGTSSQSTALFKTDVSKLTPAQRAEIAKRVANGEQISF